MPVLDLHKIWGEGRGGVYSLMDYTYSVFGSRYENDPRILAVGPSAETTDIGAVCSVPISKGKLSNVDTWAGRGGFWFKNDAGSRHCCGHLRRVP